jgi:hypothetical protein
VRIVGGEGAGSLATITKDNGDGVEPYKRQGASCGSAWYKEAQVTLQTTPLCVAAAAGSVPATRLLLERGATADGESGAAALYVVAGDEVKVLMQGALGPEPHVCVRHFFPEGRGKVIAHDI